MGHKRVLFNCNSRMVVLPECAFCFGIVAFSALVSAIVPERAGKRREKKIKQRVRGCAGCVLGRFGGRIFSRKRIERKCQGFAMIYSEDEPIRKEFRYLQRQLQNNQSLEQAVSNMAMRTQDEDMLCFAEVFEIAKRSGGDLIQVIKATERNMAERAEVKREIQTILSAKRMEGNIMNLMPCGILLYFLLCDPVYLEPLYNSIVGRVIMTVLLAAYLGCIWWSGKITEIRI